MNDSDRAEMLREYLDILATHGWADVQLMPLDEEKKPAIQGKCSLESQQAQQMLHTWEEAIAALERGHPGFFLYAGKQEHGTEGLVFADRDQPQQWPSTPNTLRVVSGSGGGDHLTYENTGNVQNSEGKSELDGAGGIRAENWGVVAPGSIHPSGGIYHVAESPRVATLGAEDLPQELRPGTVDGSAREPGEVAEVPATDIGELPEGFNADSVTNRWGRSLEEVRSTSQKLDQLLTTFNPGGQYSSPSEGDQATVAMLLIWGFEEVDIANILRACRSRQKMNRPGYIWRTIQRTALTERKPIDPDLGRAQIDNAEDGSPLVSPTSLYEVKSALSPMERATVAQIVDSGLIEWGDVGRDAVMKRVRRSLKVLADAGYVSCEDRGPFALWHDDGLEDLTLQCELESSSSVLHSSPVSCVSTTLDSDTSDEATPQKTETDSGEEARLMTDGGTPTEETMSTTQSTNGPNRTTDATEDELRERTEDVVVSRTNRGRVMHLPDEESEQDIPLCGTADRGRGWVRKDTACYPPGHRDWCNRCAEKLRVQAQAEERATSTGTPEWLLTGEVETGNALQSEWG